MNVQIGIIRYHTITDGMKYIIKLITLFHKFILHEQTGLCLNPSFDSRRLARINHTIEAISNARIDG